MLTATVMTLYLTTVGLFICLLVVHDKFRDERRRKHEAKRELIGIQIELLQRRILANRVGASADYAKGWDSATEEAIDQIERVLERA